MKALQVKSSLYMENTEKTNTSAYSKYMKGNNGFWIALGVIIIVLIIWVAVKKHHATVVAQQGIVPASVMQTPDAITPTEDLSAGSVDASKTTTPAVAPVTIAYADALVKYAGKIIQLDNQCQVTNPNSWTFKNGTDIMIDNRASSARTVKIGSTYSVKGYGFKIIKLSSAKLPATWYVDCDGQQNVATVLIQK
jgi:hypothetical protein